jgi:hypothetical protein
MTIGTFQYSQPRSIVIVNGKHVPFLSWSVDLNGYGAADTFTVDLPFRILPHLQGTTDLAITPDQASALFTNPDILVEIYVGYPSNPNSYNENDLTQIMYGYMDSADLYLQGDGSQGYYIELQGRNQVAPFMDTQTTQKYPNLTSSAIVSYLAKQQGLSTQITPTYTLAGTYYASDNTTMTSNQTQWDLIQYLAMQEGFLANVKGNTLFFGPRESLLNSKPIIYTWGQNLKTLKLSKTPHASRDIKVTVYSWQGKKKTRVSGTAEATTGYIGRVKGTNSREGYFETYYYPGLTKEQCDQRAKAILQQLSATQITGELTTYGNPAMNEYQSIQIKGVGAGIDGVTFWPTKVTHAFASASGGGSEGYYTIDVTFGNLNLPTNPGSD